MSDNNDPEPNDSETETEAGVTTEPRDGAQEEEGDQQSGGMHGYESEHNPGERVRVARMTDDVASPAESEETEPEEGGADEEDEESTERVDVTVRGEGPSEEEAEPEEAATDAVAEGDEAPEMGPSDGGTETIERPQTDPEGREAIPEEPDEEPPGEPAEFSPDLDLEETDDTDASTEEFAEMFESAGVPDQKTYSSGDRVEGEVLEIGDRFLFVELDPQNEGVAKRREFETEEGELELEVGDTAEFYVTYADEDEVQLGRQLEGDQGSLDAIREAEQNGVPVEGKVTGTNKGGFDVEVHGVDAFCPISAIELGYTEEKDIHVGATYRFKVTEVRDGGDTVVLNRADLLQEEREEKARETLEQLEEGEVVEGVVTRTANFGAFVDLGGVEGLVHLSELSHRHFDHPDDVVDEGERIEVEVLEIDMPGEDEDAGEEARISLSRQNVEQDPWAKVNDEFAVGENVEGTVVRNAPFGAFIEIAPGVEGLCHVSEMSWTEHVRTPDDVVDPGDKVTVQIQDIDIANRRISLSIRDAEGDPWDEVGETYQVGMEVQGTVENIEDFGAFIQLPTGITALMPRSEMNLPSGVTPHRKFNAGESVTAEIINIDPAEREMALAPPSDEEAREPDEEGEPGEAPSAAVDSSSDDDGGFGTLGDLIGDDLKDRD